ncbi:MAG TPA: VOC family protein [Mycobacteriales bacterium]|jgi:hypothetical protein|nr:VOC family protein [Mycobacteriales bacterium]
MTTEYELVCVLDCVDADRLAEFWAAALGYERGGTHLPYISLRDPDRIRPELLLQQVPEPKSGKNRMHLDLRIPAMEPMLTRLLGLGARVLRGPFDDNGWLTTVLADPEGNEFCALVPPNAG